MSDVTWDALICSIPHRHATLLELLADLDRQWQPGFGALLYRDNLESTYGAKTQALLDASRAQYVSCIDDDDLLAPDGVARVMAALQAQPDYVGFMVRWTTDGVLEAPVEHSLVHSGWTNRDDMLTRDITQFNPIRREIALLGAWEGGNGAEREWSNKVRASGRCREQAWVPGDPVYWYRSSAADTFKTERFPLPAEKVPPVPSYPWLTVIAGSS
jgi:hypothetical protein